VGQKPFVNIWLEHASANQYPQSVHPGLAGDCIVKNKPGQPGADLIRIALGEQSLRRFPEVNVRAAQPLDQLFVAFARQIELAGTRRALVAAVKPAGL
jgi:hypothetical protein